MPQLIEVPLDRLDSGENIRSAGVGDLDEMVASVSAVGIVTPVTVYQPDGSSRWMLVAGHRRVEAARRAGFGTVPTLQLDAALSADDRLAVALVENLLREDIDPIDEANSYMRLREHGWTISKIAGRVGHSRAHVRRRCALLELSTPLIDKVRRGNIRVSHADTLVQLARGGATPKQLERHSTEPPLQAERAFKRQQAETGRITREAELADAGVTVVTADEFPFFQELGHNDIDYTEHSSEPCHVATVGVDPEPDNPTVNTWFGCTNLAEHSNTPKRPSPEEIMKQANEERRRSIRNPRGDRQKQNAALNAASVEFGRRLKAVDDAIVVDAVVRLMGYFHMGKPPDYDALLPTEGVDNPRGFGCPEQVITDATTADLARGLLRGHMEQAERDKKWEAKPLDEPIRLIFARIQECLPQDP